MALAPSVGFATTSTATDCLTNMPDTLVIVDATGTEHEFPAGMDPQKAAAIVRGYGGSGPATAPPTASTQGMMAQSTEAGDPMQPGAQAIKDALTWSGKMLGGAFMGPQGAQAVDSPALTLASAGIPSALRTARPYVQPATQAAARGAGMLMENMGSPLTMLKNVGGAVRRWGGYKPPSPTEAFAPVHGAGKYVPPVRSGGSYAGRSQPVAPFREAVPETTAAPEPYQPISKPGRYVPPAPSGGGFAGRHQPIAPFREAVPEAIPEPPAAYQPLSKPGRYTPPVQSGGSYVPRRAGGPGSSAPVQGSTPSRRSTSRPPTEGVEVERLFQQLARKPVLTPVEQIQFEQLQKVVGGRAKEVGLGYASGGRRGLPK